MSADDYTLRRNDDELDRRVKSNSQWLYLLVGVVFLALIGSGVGIWLSMSARSEVAKLKSGVEELQRQHLLDDIKDAREGSIADMSEARERAVEAVKKAKGDATSRIEQDARHAVRVELAKSLLAKEFVASEQTIEGKGTNTLNTIEGMAHSIGVQKSGTFAVVYKCDGIDFFNSENFAPLVFERNKRKKDNPQLLSRFALYVDGTERDATVQTYGYSGGSAYSSKSTVLMWIGQLDEGEHSIDIKAACHEGLLLTISRGSKQRLAVLQVQ